MAAALISIALIFYILRSDASGRFEGRVSDEKVSGISVTFNEGTSSTLSPPTWSKQNPMIVDGGRQIPFDEKWLRCEHRLGTKGLEFEPLPQSAVEGVEKFAFFAGYPRSGHSMIGSVMDAHPNMIIAHEYRLFKNCYSMLEKGENLFAAKFLLFNTLYKKSYLDAKCGWRSDKDRKKKGYNFNFNSKWQGAFSQLKVIGDKSGGCVGLQMHVHGKTCLQQMIDSLHVPIVAVHVIRNPYDMIATAITYLNADQTKKGPAIYVKQNVSADMQMERTKHVFMLADSVVKVKTYVPVVEIPIEDFIQDPSRIVMKLCHSLGVECPQEYVDRVTAKAYKNVSRSRDLISWSPSVLTFIQQQIIKYPFFEGYTFEDSFRQVI